MKILVISNNYPSLKDPGRGAFVYNLVQEFAKTNKVTLISPEKAQNTFKRSVTESYGNEGCEVIRPLYLGFSNKNILGRNTIGLTRYFTEKAVNKALRNYKDKPDIVYCHFLNNAVPVLGFVERNGLPLIIASGESEYIDWKTQPLAIQEKLKELVCHIICVSESNRERLRELGFDADKMTIIPNAVNVDLFKPLDKLECKKKLGYSADDFVIGFVGNFIERKGPNRVIQAIKKLDNPAIKLICVGKGGALEGNTFTQIIPPMPNSSLPEIFNAFDLFCLPTLREGHCNAIEEAKACAVPVISSLGTSVEAQITERQGILIDPNSIENISKAIHVLYKDAARYNGLICGLKESKVYSIEQRANEILGIASRVLKK